MFKLQRQIFIFYYSIPDSLNEKWSQWSVHAWLSIWKKRVQEVAEQATLVLIQLACEVAARKAWYYVVYELYAVYCGHNLLGEMGKWFWNLILWNPLPLINQSWQLWGSRQSKFLFLVPHLHIWICAVLVLFFSIWIYSYFSFFSPLMMIILRSQ